MCSRMNRSSSHSIAIAWTTVNSTTKTVSRGENPFAKKGPTVTTVTVMSATPAAFARQEFGAERLREDSAGRGRLRARDGPKIIYYGGAFSIERVTYLLSETAVAAADDPDRSDDSRNHYNTEIIYLTKVVSIKNYLIIIFNQCTHFVSTPS